MKLYDAAWAPSPRRVRIFLAEKGVEVPVERIDLRADAQLSPDFLAVNPRGCVPALQLDDGEVLTESAAICRYFEALHPNPALFGGDDPVFVARIEQWTRRIESEGYQAIVFALREGNPAFATRPMAGAWPQTDQLPALADRARMMWGQFGDVLETRLAETRWIAGDAISYADITALVTVEFARAGKLPDLRERPAIGRWHAEMAARPSAGA